MRSDESVIKSPSKGMCKRLRHSYSRLRSFVAFNNQNQGKDGFSEHQRDELSDAVDETCDADGNSVVSYLQAPILNPFQIKNDCEQEAENETERPSQQNQTADLAVSVSIAIMMVGIKSEIKRGACITMHNFAKLRLARLWFCQTTAPPFGKYATCSIGQAIFAFRVYLATRRRMERYLKCYDVQTGRSRWGWWGTAHVRILYSENASEGVVSRRSSVPEP